MRTMRFVMVALEVLLSLCINAKELYITVDDVDYKIDTHEKTATVTGRKHHQLSGYCELIIPSTITYEGVLYKVTKIADAHADGTGVFEENPYYDDYSTNRRYLTSVIIGDNVEIIVDLIYPVALNVGLRFAIREGGRTVGSGQITEVYED